MIYIIIALILVVAPLLHFMPSKRQRLQASLREAAAVGGLLVEFRSLPEEGRAAQRLPRGGLIYYGLRLKPSRGRHKRRRGAWIFEAGEWRALGGQASAIPAPLLTLPPVVLAASVDEVSCGVYWQEEGDLETVAQIQRCLADWGGQIQA